MKLTKEQIEAFRKIHEGTDILEGLSSQDVERLAQSVAQYYLSLFKIHQRLKAEGHTFSTDNSELEEIT